MEYDLNRVNNRYRFDSFGNVGEPTELDVVVNDRIGTEVNVLDVIEDNKQYFFNNIAHLNCYFFNSNIIKLLGQTLPIYSIKKEQEEQASPLIRYFRNGKEIKNVRVVTNGVNYFDSMPLSTIIKGTSKNYDMADLFYEWRTNPDYKPLEINLKI